ncbi:cupredoxin domain-containing protein [Leucobacter sp. CSA1]|uniref:Cupredoxin domain-containing protein n=1 Tax=Leucobacter chromiisoli TaxID=2796471 RepID=A0A934UVP8_9MICO|nr:cupredoxin domain-containing protein [Leucobacter chromiisoli]MBK0420140.1 cupredoxin domain-containing protein [Leucobacter chromiisoli]
MSAGADASRRAVLGGLAGALGLGALTALSGCSAGKPEVVPSDEGVEPAVTVRVIDNAYEPAEVEIAAGAAVRWVFEGPTEHDVVAEDGGFVSELLTEGEYVHVFDESGEYAYDCSIHPEMTGVVRVS